MRQELEEHWEDQKARDGEIVELNNLVETLMGEVNGMGNFSDPTPEASRVVGGNPPPPPAGGAAVTSGGGDPDDEAEVSGRRPEDCAEARCDERPTPQPGTDYDEAEDEQFALLS